jgi:hypothetical protein
LHLTQSYKRRHGSNVIEEGRKARRSRRNDGSSRIQDHTFCSIGVSLKLGVLNHADVYFAERLIHSMLPAQLVRFIPSAN